MANIRHEAADVGSWTQVRAPSVPELRRHYLGWLEGQLSERGVRARVMRPDGGGTEVLRVERGDGARFIACVPAPQRDTWAWVWPRGWALVTDPGAVAMVAKDMAR
jgi:hypothetical protein